MEREVNIEYDSKIFSLSLVFVQKVDQFSYDDFDLSDRDSYESLIKFTLIRRRLRNV